MAVQSLAHTSIQVEFWHNIKITVPVTMENKKDKFQTEAENDESKHSPKVYEGDSILDHILYGVGTLIVVVGPLLIPGISSKVLIAGFFGGVIVIYIAICLLGAWKSIMGNGRSQRRHGR